NGLWTAASYDLTTTILREEWGFEGLVMTDWWAHINRRGCPADQRDFAAMAMAQNDVYMVCADGSDNDDNTLEELQKGTLSRGELQRNAANICRVLMRTHAMDRMEGKEETVEIINRPKDADSSDDREVKCYDCKGGLTISPDDIRTDKGCDYIFIADVSPTGYYTVTVTASSEASELAQLPVTLFSMGSPCAAFTWNGTGGKPESKQSGKIFFFSRFTTLRLYFAQSGLKIHSIELRSC
ncbi:MAG: beta-glucosidase, partial [Ruminococcus sp.]|nr:beta-glucosidase [Ruminococcus sp.]